jgi:hypothetical protein
VRSAKFERFKCPNASQRAYLPHLACRRARFPAILDGTLRSDLSRAQTTADKQQHTVLSWECHASVQTIAAEEGSISVALQESFTCMLGRVVDAAIAAHTAEQAASLGTGYAWSIAQVASLGCSNELPSLSLTISPAHGSSRPHTDIHTNWSHLDTVSRATWL